MEIKTDTLVFEFVPLPVIDLSVRFLYRFLQPVPTVWVQGGIPFGSFALDPRDGPASYSDFALEKFKAMLEEESVRAAGLRQTLPWLFDVNKVHVTRCKIVPDVVI